jgi:four helix bundle protein
MKKQVSKKVIYSTQKVSHALGESIPGYDSEIGDRTIKFSLRIMKLYRVLEKDSLGRLLGKQLLRSGTSIGANVQEGLGGQSRADFVAKLSIAYKEARETLYWIRLIEEDRLINPTRLHDLKEETLQITKILASILISSKNSTKR